MAELVDAPDSKSGSAWSVGSIPTRGTIILKNDFLFLGIIFYIHVAYFFNQYFTKMFQVSNMIKIEKSAHMVWALISSPGHLNQFHPFCEQNKVLESKNDVILKDQLNYLNGLIYYRTFTDWNPMIGYSIKIGSKNGKESDVKWQIIDKGAITYVKITVKPYTSNKIPKLFYPIFHYAVIRPKLKSYLKSVLRGLQYYLTHKKPVPRNEFGNHSWFT